MSVCCSVLSLCGEEVEETEIEGLSSDKQTFHCANVIGKKVIQVREHFSFCVTTTQVVCTGQRNRPFCREGVFLQRLLVY